jgi:hypothetical protein
MSESKQANSLRRGMIATVGAMGTDTLILSLKRPGNDQETYNILFAEALSRLLVDNMVYLHNSPKWHREVGKDNSPDNCKACITKLQKRRKP